MKIALKNIEEFKLSGVYMIKNCINNKVYIGSTKNSFKRRYQEHVRRLKTNKHHNIHLTRSVNTYGIENFEFSIIEILDKSSINIRNREKFFIDKFKSVSDGYNHSNNTTSPPLTKETKEKIRKKLKELYKEGSKNRERLKKNSDSFKGKPSWNKGKKCKSISDARKEMFDDIEVYNSDMIFFRRFDNALAIEKLSRSKENDLPIKLGGKVKHKIIYNQNIYRALRENKPYKTLYFKRIKRNG